MIINYVKETGTLWHSDCNRDCKWAPPMKEIEIGKDKNLLECTACGQKGWLRHGAVGKTVVGVING